MAITTANTVTVQHIIPRGTPKPYTMDNVSLWVTFNSVRTRFDTPTITLNTLLSTGFLGASSVPLSSGDGVYVLEFTYEDTVDLDTSGVVVSTIAKGSVTRVSNNTVITV